MPASAAPVAVHHIERPAPTELPALTGLRGFAALWVLVYHVWVDAVPRAMTLGAGGVTLDLTPLFSCGWAGVDIFFTLSAFLLSLPFANWTLGVAPRPSLRTFWLRRVLRILPAWYAQIAVLLVLAVAFGLGARPGIRQFLGNLVLWFNLGPGSVAPMNPIASTLTIEFCFYVVLPLLALLLRPRWWWLLALLAIVETQLWRHAAFSMVAQADVPHRVVALEQMPGRLDQFVAGMLAAYAYSRGVLRRRLPSAALSDALFVFGMAVVAVMIVLIHLGSGTYWDGSVLLFTWHGLVGAAVALMLYAAAAGSRVASALFANAPLRYLGLVSFGLYLWHYPLIEWLGASHVFDAFPGYRMPWSLPIVLLLACALAQVSYRVVERPLLRIGRRSRHPGLTTDLVRAEAPA